MEWNIIVFEAKMMTGGFFFGNEYNKLIENRLNLIFNVRLTIP